MYRAFAHLVLFTDEFLKLTQTGYNTTQINQVLDEIESYKNNKKYTSLYLTAKNWLGAAPLAANVKNTRAAHTGGRIVNIASAFEQALQHG